MTIPWAYNVVPISQRPMAVEPNGWAPRLHLDGLRLSTAAGSATFGIAAGEAVSAAEAIVMTLPTAYTKTTSAWAVGSGNGALDTGSIANDTWYHVFLIWRGDTQVVDVLISTSATSPTMPANYTQKRRIGATDGSAQWRKFTQRGDHFLWDVPVQDIGSANHDTTATTRTLGSVPSGVQVDAHVSVITYNTATLFSMITSLDQADTAPNTTSMFTQTSPASAYGSQNYQLRTNTSAQIRTRSSIDSSLLYIITNGWIDTRGRLD